MTLNNVNDVNGRIYLETEDKIYATINDAQSIVAPVRDSIFELSDRVRIMGVDFEDVVKSLTDLSMAS